MADHPVSLSDCSECRFRKWLLSPRCSFFSASPNSSLPHRRDMLVWGNGGVPAFMVPSLCQSEVTPRTMSQASHLQQAL